MTDYENDPNYEFEEEGVYKDLRTNETVFVFDGENADLVRKAFALEDDQEDYTLTVDDVKKIIEPQFNKLISSEENLFSDDSDLGEL